MPELSRLACDAALAARTPLEYLALWHDLHEAEMAVFCAQPALRASGHPRPGGGPAPKRRHPAALREALRAYEAAHPQEPIVALAQDPAILTADLALLHVLLLDAQACTPDSVGLPVVRAASIACGTANNTQALERLAPAGPLVTRKLATLTGIRGGLTHGDVAAGPELLKLAWAGNSLLHGNAPASPKGRGRRSKGMPAGFPFAAGGPKLADEQAVGTRITPIAGAPFVLPPDAQAQFQQVLHALQHGATLRREFGFATTMPTAGGARVLFYGPPGTGKTTACGALAAALGKDMLVVHPNDVLDKFVGSSEKRLVAAFESAAKDNLLLVLDEIDAFAYARHDASQPHQRQQVTQLLLLLEKHSDLVFAATTNDPKSLDEALERRMTFRIHVQRPGAEERARLWAEMLPAQLPRAADVDIQRLAAQYEVTGAQIRDAVFQAGIRMLEQGRREMQMADLEAALVLVQGGRWTEEDRGGPIGFSGR